LRRCFVNFSIVSADFGEIFFNCLLSWLVLEVSPLLW
jgi:hypothetical protein